jgi:hypothetical protein
MGGTVEALVEGLDLFQRHGLHGGNALLQRLRGTPVAAG